MRLHKPINLNEAFNDVLVKGLAVHHYLLYLNLFFDLSAREELTDLWLGKGSRLVIQIDGFITYDILWVISEQIVLLSDYLFPFWFVSEFRVLLIIKWNMVDTILRLLYGCLLFFLIVFVNKHLLSCQKHFFNSLFNVIYNLVLNS